MRFFQPLSSILIDGKDGPGSFDGSYSVAVPSHGIALLKIGTPK
jgi:hypothetical protein